jgi:antitoxin ParD1/3/4
MSGLGEIGVWRGIDKSFAQDGRKPRQKWDCGFVFRHKQSYYDDLAMTSLNISLPAALKSYVEGQVASGDWGPPSEYVRELIRQDKERRLGNLEQDLVAAAKGPKIELAVSEIRRKGLLSALRERTRAR